MRHHRCISLSVLIPTRDRAESLDRTLRSLRAQHDGEVIIVVDGPEDPATRAVAAAHDASLDVLGAHEGINTARNRATELATHDLLAFIDDDVELWPTWKQALLSADPDAGCLGGPIRPRLEGPHAPHGCGRPEDAPVTALDHDTGFAWGANFAIRRTALDTVGPFDPSLYNCGDEEDWQRRLYAAGGTVAFLENAGVDHIRSGDAARLRNLARAAYHRGRAAREYDVRKGTAPPLPTELRVLAGTLFHVARHRCPTGLVPVARTLGRLRAY